MPNHSRGIPSDLTSEVKNALRFAITASFDSSMVLWPQFPRCGRAQRWVERVGLGRKTIEENTLEGSGDGTRKVSFLWKKSMGESGVNP